MQDFKYKEIEDGGVCVTGYFGDEVHVVVPDTMNQRPVTVIFDDLFRNHPEIESVTFPKTVTDIGSFVFDGCSNLKKVELPESLRYIWQCAFVRCGLEEIVIPSKITSIPPETFKDCKNLKKVVLPAGLESIRARAFKGCDQLKDVKYGPDVEVSESAFEK